MGRAASTEEIVNEGVDGFDPAPIDWIVFDLDGTLRHNQPDGLATFFDLVREQGIPVDAEAERAARRWNLSYWASSAELLEDERAAGDDRNHLYQRYTRRHLEQLGAAADLDELASELHRRMMEEYEPEDHVPADVLPTLAKLRAQGYRLGLLTNRSQLKEEMVSRLSLDGAFDFMVAAGEVGWWKPDPRIFHHVVEQAGAQPRSTLYVGDNPYADVAGASAAGLQPILIDPYGLFPHAACPVIRTVGDLPPLLSAGG